MSSTRHCSARNESSSRRRARTALAVLLAGTAISIGVAKSDVTSGDPLLDALAAEVDRAMQAFAEVDPRPYFIGVELTESQRRRTGL